MPCAASHGSSSSRSPWCSRENSFCTDATGWIAWQRSISARSKFDTPIRRALPADTSSAIAPHVSSIGTSSDGQCTW